MVFDEATLKRFWSKVDKSGGPDACWEWAAYIGTHGYGAFTIHFDKTHKTYRAHRLALIFSGTNTSSDAPICMHSCDNKTCCNPAHLRWGTQSENIKDAHTRNKEWSSLIRSRLIEDNKISYRRMLSPSQVDYIKILVSAGYSSRQCAKWYCISPSTIQRIVNGIYYRNV